MSHSKLATGVVLIGPTTWETWFQELQLLANLNGVWDYINPDPKLRRELAAPTAPTSQSNTARDLFKHRLRTYESNLSSIRQIGLHILSTTDTRTKAALYGTTDVPSQVELLHKRFKKTTATIVQDATEQYEKARRFSPQRESFLEWSKDFTVALDLAERHNIPILQLPFAAQYDIVNALAKLDNTYAKTIQIQLDNEKANQLRIKEEVGMVEAIIPPSSGAPANAVPRTVMVPGILPPVPDNCSVDHIMNLCVEQAAKQRPYRPNRQASFAAKLNGENSPYNPDMADSRSSSKPTSGSLKRSNSKSTDSREPDRKKQQLDRGRQPCPCGNGDSHDGIWGLCPYIIERIRSPSFTPDPRIASKVARWASVSARRREILKAIRKKDADENPDIGELSGGGDQEL